MWVKVKTLFCFRFLEISAFGKRELDGDVRGVDDRMALNKATNKTLNIGTNKTLNLRPLSRPRIFETDF
jgi:hypothetical protein